MRVKHLVILIAAVSILIIPGCKKSEDCYDKQMQENHSGICTQDCPLVCGCDGLTYCNECLANSRGISVVYNGPCD